jgi:phage shock protein A
MIAAVFALLAYGRVRRLQATGEALAARAAEVARRGEELESRLAGVDARTEEVRRHVERLEASFERLAVLSWALGDARRSITRVRGAYLRK